MDFIIIALILFLLNICLSIALARIIYSKLYISKKFNKADHFHFYNDLFSWEIFFIFIAIEIVFQIASMFILNAEIFILILKIRLYILIFLFWLKIIHTEKIMNIITYERHYYGGIISFIIVIILFVSNASISIIILVFLVTSLIPFLVISLFFKNTEKSTVNNLKSTIGIILITMGCLITPEILVEFDGTLEASDFLICLILLTSPILLIIGTILIYASFYREI